MLAPIFVSRVRVTLGDVVALQDLSFEVAAGEVVCLLGPNGAGKTTTVEVCSGLRVPDDGEARILGDPVAKRSAKTRNAIGLVPQDTALYEELTGWENLNLFGAMYPIAGLAGRIQELVDLMGLSDRARDRVSAYSGGMKRRLALARALLHDPPVLFLDEPTLGVDVHGRRQIWDHVVELRAEGKSVVLTTNYLDEATALADRVIILNKGVVIADESPNELRRQAGMTLELHCAGEVEAIASALDKHPEVRSIEIAGRTLRVGLTSEGAGPKVIAVANEAGELSAFHTVEPTLEDVFLELTRADTTV
jgi:ABC-2 type transport system ATP-binding protein